MAVKFVIYDILVHVNWTYFMRTSGGQIYGLYENI